MTTTLTPAEAIDVVLETARLHDSVTGATVLQFLKHNGYLVVPKDVSDKAVIACASAPRDPGAPKIDQMRAGIAAALRSMAEG